MTKKLFFFILLHTACCSYLYTIIKKYFKLLTISKTKILNLKLTKCDAGHDQNYSDNVR